MAPVKVEGNCGITKMRQQGKSGEREKGSVAAIRAAAEREQ